MTQAAMLVYVAGYLCATACLGMVAIAGVELAMILPAAWEAGHS
jgi:hypothetical protein